MVRRLAETRYNASAEGAFGGLVAVFEISH